MASLLCERPLDPKHYTQLRLTVADRNEVVIEGTSYPLKVPSGMETGIKLNLDFTIEEDESVEILVNFDASASITWTPGNYILRPALRTFKQINSGSVSGMVKDRDGKGVPSALVQAISMTYSTATLTDNVGLYRLILTEGSFEIRASAEDYSAADTVYRRANRI